MTKGKLGALVGRVYLDDKGDGTKEFRDEREKIKGLARKKERKKERKEKREKKGKRERREERKKERKRKIKGRSCWRRQTVLSHSSGRKRARVLCVSVV
ncbi:hypothetical protein ANTRET_LOCUS2866 [Anthophora retusa]